MLRSISKERSRRSLRRNHSLWLDKWKGLSNNQWIWSLEHRLSKLRGSKLKLSQNPLLSLNLDNPDSNCLPKEKDPPTTLSNPKPSNQTKKPKKQPPFDPKPTNSKIAQKRKESDFKSEPNLNHHQRDQP